MLKVGETVSPLEPSTKMPNLLFLTLSDFLFPENFDIASHDVYLIVADVYTDIDTHCIADTDSITHTIAVEVWLSLTQW